MGRNIEALRDSDKFVMPEGFDTQQEEFFELRAEWQLERLRRTDFDLLGEHAKYAQDVIDSAAEDTRERFVI